MGRQNTPIMTPDGQFDSIKKAAEHYGVWPSVIAYRMGMDPEHYYRLVPKATYDKHSEDGDYPMIYHPPAVTIDLREYWATKRRQKSA